MDTLGFKAPAGLLPPGLGGQPAPGPTVLPGQVDPRAAAMKLKLGGKNLAAKDPLMKKGHVKVANHQTKTSNNVDQSTADRILQLTLLTAIPLSIYVGILMTFMYKFYRYPWFTVAVCGTTGGICLLQYLAAQSLVRRRQNMWKKWLGGLGLAATIFASMMGVYLHYEFMLLWRKYSDMVQYSNVAASQSALEFEDASTIGFTEGTNLDKNRAVGFRDIRNSKTLCVAPVVDGQMGQSDPITFFAVGVNCCGWRASFHCDDAAISGARSGLLKLPASSLVSSSMEWAVDDNFDFESFDKAVDLLKSVFAVSTSKNFRYLKWVEDPKKAIDNYRKRGLEAALITIAGFFILGVILSIRDLANETARQAKLAKAFTNSNGGAVDYQDAVEDDP